MLRMGRTFCAVCGMIAQAEFTFLAVINAQKDFVANFQASLRINFVSDREDGSCTLRIRQRYQHQCMCPGSFNTVYLVPEDGRVWADLNLTLLEHKIRVACISR